MRFKPDGSLRWIFETRVFAAGPPGIGPDNTSLCCRQFDNHCDQTERILEMDFH